VWFWLRIKGAKLTPVIFSHGPNNGFHVEWRVKKDRIISADVTNDTPENYRCFSTCGSLFRLNLTIVLDFCPFCMRTLPIKINYIYTLYETDQKCSQMSCLFTFLKLVHIYKLCFLTICIYCIYLLNLVDKMCN
jgi:hypothetical protein